MGIAVYLEDQIHGRTYAGPEASAQLAKVLAVAKPQGLLAGIHLYGDTMFNIVQLRKLEPELNAIADANPDLRSDIDALKRIFEKVTKSRGYLWLSGD
jgi:hypothetical protein